VCDQYVVNYITCALFAEIRDEGWTGEKLWDKFAEVYSQFVNFSLVAICYGYIC